MKVENGVLLYIDGNDIENRTFNKWEGITEIGSNALGDWKTLKK